MDAIERLGQLIKGQARGGKYFRRVATGNPRRPWKYYYTKEQYQKEHGDQAHLHGSDSKTKHRMRSDALDIVNGVGDQGKKQKASKRKTPWNAETIAKETKEWN